MISDEQEFPGEGGWIPGLAVEGGETCEFGMFLRIGFQQDDVAHFGHDEDVIITKQNLAVAIAAVLPRGPSAVQLNAGKDSVVQPEDMVVVMDEIGELGLHATGVPEPFSCELVAVF